METNRVDDMLGDLEDALDPLIGIARTWFQTGLGIAAAALGAAADALRTTEEELGRLGDAVDSAVEGDPFRDRDDEGARLDA